MFTGIVLFKMRSLQGRISPLPWSQQRNMLQTREVWGCKQQCVFPPWLHIQMNMEIHASVKGLVREISRRGLSAVEMVGFLEMTAVVVTPAHLLTGNRIQKNLKDLS